jgi:signal transduction histidine kinase
LSDKISDIIDAVRDTSDKKMIEISRDIPDRLTIIADIQMFESLMRNLIFNAVKFTPKGGKVYITALPVSDNSVEISVSDTGIGMDQNMIDHLFQLNEQVNRCGTEGESSTGLGLIICKDFIEKHGGKISVESEEGIGSTFRFTLPNQIKSVP